MKLLKSCLIIVLGTTSSLSALTKTTTTISSSQNPSIMGQAVTLTAVVSCAVGAPPDGEIITFKQGSNILGTAPTTSGSAALTITTLAGGTDDVRAIYPGDSTFATSTSSTLAQAVNAATTATGLISLKNPSNSGQSIVLTATVTAQYGGTVTGTVGFYSGSTKLGTASLVSGTGSYTTARLSVGTDQLTAVYQGTKSYLTSTSNAVSQVVGTGTTLDETMTWDGVTRYYQLFIPTALSANPPMLLMLHGTTFEAPPANPSTKEWYWESVADEFGFVLVQPASTYNASTNQWNWNSYFMDAAFTAAEVGTCTSPPATSCPDDAGFLRQLIVNLTSQYNVNPDMIFVTGFSSGAQMTERVGVELSDLVAAIAPTSGQMEGQQAAPPPVLAPASVVAPISVQEWHGTVDTELPPCNYGTTVYSKVTYYLDTVDDTFNYWVQQNACTTLQTTQTLCTDGEATAGLSGNVATNCGSNSNVEVQFIWEQNVGHTWTSGNNTSRWLFLSAHPKPTNGADSRRAGREEIR